MSKKETSMSLLSCVNEKCLRYFIMHKFTCTLTLHFNCHMRDGYPDLLGDYQVPSLAAKQ